MKGDRITRCTAVLEQQLSRRGYRFIAGVDEVGRGALAGPVVAAAVILDLSNIPDGIDDSKKLRPARRSQLAEAIRLSARAVSVAAVEAGEIDRINILEATKRAMLQALAGLQPAPDFVLVDALTLPNLPIPQRAIVHGDSLSVSIAAASIVAKAWRDRLMVEYDRLHPGYGFARNAGYGTKEHLQALQKLGPSPIHRLTFRGTQTNLFPL
ncbi:MAG TPA: ribonuclease HII [Blastocatellia bacterium]|nr:ribonuclease HII [Blastocatellia bacterium]